MVLDFKALFIYLFRVDWTINQPVFPCVAALGCCGWAVASAGALGPECRGRWENWSNFTLGSPLQQCLGSQSGFSNLHEQHHAALALYAYFLYSSISVILVFLPQSVKYLFFVLLQEYFPRCVLSLKRKVTLGCIKEMGPWWSGSFPMVLFSLWHLTNIKR